MKMFLLGLTLLCGSCQSFQGASDTAPAPLPADTLSVSASPLAPAAETEQTLPRFNHLDRAEHAVRAWVRDRN